MLIRAAAILFALAATCAVADDSPLHQAPGVKAEQQANGATSGNQGAEANKNPAAFPAPVQIQAAPIKTKEERDREEQKAAEEASEYWVILDHRMKVTDFFLALFTGLLFVVTAILIAVGVSQSKQLRRTVDTSLIEAQPVLSPYALNMDGLHPVFSEGTTFAFKGKETFTSTMLLAFENYGKTPAIIRRVQAELFITLNDAIPNVIFEKLSTHFFQETIPGETFHTDLIGRPGLPVTKEFSLTDPELHELFAEAEGKWRRVFLVGQVIYDDFYDVRHTKRFCRKFRLTNIVKFQAQHGGISYNSVKREPIPKYDPLDTPQ